MKTAIIVGTRPEIIKLAPVIKELEDQKKDFFIIHTNQHYDHFLDSIFFEELQLKHPKYNLKIKSISHSDMVGQMMIRIDKIFMEEVPDIVIVQGDTNTTLAGALVAAKNGIKLVHIEAGARSFDRTMPEEINRVVTDSLSDILFAITDYEKQNLLNEGIVREKIYLVGNTTPEALQLVEKVISPQRLKKFSVTSSKFVIITVHRPSNVDSKDSLKELFSLFSYAGEKYLSGYIFLWPIHPRTKKNIEKFKLKIPTFIRVIEPVGYLDMVSLIKYAKLVFTDSGGILEEAYLLKVPCITLRDTIELKMTVDSGYNYLVHRDKKLVGRALKHHLYEQKYRWSYPYPKEICKTIVQTIFSDPGVYL